MSHDIALMRFVLDSAADRETRLGYWREWADAGDIDDHSHQVFDLFPAVYLALVELGESHRWLVRLKGVHRQAWTRNEFHRAALDKAATALEMAGLDHILPWWADPGDGDQTRPTTVAFADPRIVVRWADAGRAASALALAGWASDPAPRGGLGPLGVIQSFDRLFTNNESGAVIGLSDHLLPGESGETRADAPWPRTVPSGTGHGRRASAVDIARAILTEPEPEGGSYRWALEFTAFLEVEALASSVELAPSSDTLGALARHRLDSYADVTGHKIEVVAGLPSPSPRGVIRLIRNEIRAARRFDEGARALARHRRTLADYGLHRLRRFPGRAARCLGFRPRHADGADDPVTL